MTIWYFIIGFIVLFIAYIIYKFYKMKNIKDVATSDKIKTLDNKSFKAVGKKKGLVLVDFWAPWCAPCKMMTPILNDIAETKSDKLTIAKVNVDQNKQLSQKYKIRSIPTIILFKDGKEYKRLMGYKSKKILLKEMGID